MSMLYTYPCTCMYSKPDMYHIQYHVYIKIKSVWVKMVSQWLLSLECTLHHLHWWNWCRGQKEGPAGWVRRSWREREHAQPATGGDGRVHLFYQCGGTGRDQPAWRVGPRPAAPRTLWPADLPPSPWHQGQVLRAMWTWYIYMYMYLDTHSLDLIRCTKTCIHVHACIIIQVCNVHIHNTVYIHVCLNMNKWHFVVHFC